MNARTPWLAATAAFLLTPTLFAAPSISPPIEVAPRLFVPSYYTSEPVQAIAAGGGSVAVLDQGGRLSLLTEDLALLGDPLSKTFAASNIIFDGTNFLLAKLAQQPPSGSSDYLAAIEVQRLAPDGTLADPLPTLGEVQQSGTFDTVVAIGCKAPGDCLVAYSLRLYGTGGTSYQDIWTVPVKDGKPGTAVQVTTAANDQFRPAVAWDGTTWIVAWVDLRFATANLPNYKDSQIYGTRVTPTGAVLDPIGIPLSTFAELADNPNGFAEPLPAGIALARSGGTTLLAWRGTHSNRILGRRLGTDLTLLDATPVVLATPGASWADAPRLLPAVDGFTAIVGESGSGFGNTNVDILQIGLDGQPKGAPVKAGTRFAYAAFAARLSDNTIALAKTVPGPNNNVLGDPYTDAWVERVNDSGTELGSAYVSKSLTVVDGRAMAHSPGIGVVVYADNRTSDNGEYPTRQVFATVLTSGGAVLPPNGLLLTTPPRNVVAAAAGASRALVLWEEGVYGARNVVGALIDASGTLVKSVSFGIAPYDESSPQAAFDGQNFVVSWVDRGNGYDAGVFRRMAPDGTFVDPAFVFVAPGQTSTTTVGELVCNASGGCLARSESSYRMLQNGVVAATKSAWEVGITGFDNPLLAGGGTGFALLTMGASYADIAFIRLGADLSVKDTPAVDIFDAHYVSGIVPSSKVVGWNGNRFVTGWLNSKGVSLASLAETGSPSSPYLLTQVRGVPGPYSTIGNEAARNLLVSGESDRTVVGYQDAGRLLVRSVTALEDTGGTGGTGGSAGTGGTGGTGGSAGTGGTGGSAATGGSAGAGGLGGAGGSAGAAGVSAAPQSSDNGGCSCHTTARGTEPSGLAWAGLLVGLGLIKRRRSR